MKLAIVINNLGMGGAERLVIDDIHELMRRGQEVDLITLKPEPSGRSQSGRLHLDKQHQHLLSFVGLLKYLRRAQPDAVITHLWYSNALGRVAAKFAGIKTVISFEHNVYDSLKTWKMFLVDRLLQGCSTKVVAVSESVKRSLIRHGIKESRIVVIKNGVDTKPYRRVLQSKLDGNHRDFTFIFIGRLIPQKGVDILLTSFSKMKSKAKLLIVGEGKDRKSLDEQAQRLNLSDCVEFLGIRQDIPELLSTSDCFVLPSRYEGLPMVLLEALAAGKPAITSDFESARDVIDEGKNGLIVPREDATALTDAMDKVVRDPALFETLKIGANQGQDAFSIQRHVDALLALA